jgi:predicted dehydrogenase
MKRRSFLKLTGATALSAPPVPGKVLGANDRIRVAVLGLGMRGPGLAAQAAAIPGVELAAICDPDTQRLDAACAALGKDPQLGTKVRSVRDFRRILDDPQIDAVLIATQNHWHAHMTLMACQAGKDAMVEKPICHNLWEGWRMIDGVRKSNRIVAGGFQARADKGLLEFFDWLESEHHPLGKLKAVHGFWYNSRESIGRRDTPLTPPTTIDYNLWLGPARDEPVYRNQLHYDWHWLWNTGNGEIGNLGSHQMDICRWAIGDVTDLPVRMISAGSRFAFHDAGETPNMHWACFDFGIGIPVVLEVRNLALRPGEKRGNGFKGISAAMILAYEHGEFRGGRGGGTLYDNNNRKIRKFQGDGGNDHLPSFFRAMRSRRTSDLRCKLEDAVHSTHCCHLAAISTRIGHAAPPTEVGQTVAALPPVMQETWAHLDAHLANWQIDYAKEPWLLGPELTYDWHGRQFTHSNPATALTRAAALHQREYRKEFPFPEV